jgi:hypothetical protein
MGDMTFHWIRRKAVLTLSLLLLGSILTVGTGSAQPPTISVSTVSPSNGATVAGKITWEAQVQGSTHFVYFSIDGVQKWTEERAPYVYGGDGNALDTTTLSDGTHTLTVSASGQGQRSASQQITVTVANGTSAPPPPLPPPPTSSGAPQLVGAPTVAGSAVVGQSLSGSTGTWSGSPTAYAYAWRRCDASGAACSAISGATAASKLLVSADQGATLRVAVTASNASGSTVAVSAPSGIVQAAPSSSAVAWPDVTPPAFTSNRIASTVSDFSSIMGSLKAGDVVEVKPMTLTGEIVFGQKLSAPADIHFDAGVKFTGTAVGTLLPAVWIHGSNLRLYGGDVSGQGNDCVRVGAASSDSTGPTNIRWWGATIHDCGGTGFSAQASTHPNTGLDIAADISHAGENLALDPHAEKGTGLHGAYLGGGNAVTSGRFVLTVHDQPTGAALQGGANLQNSDIWLRADRITFKSTSVAGAGNALQLWGGQDKNVVVHDLEADNLAGRAVETESLTAGTGNIVNYARATNVAVTPMYQGSNYLTCSQCG